MAQRLVHPVPTPIPSSPNELATIVARIYDRTELTLPRIERLATEARDTGIDLKSRVRVLETEPGHACDEKGRQAEQDEVLKEVHGFAIEAKEQIKGFSSFRKWLIGIISTVVLVGGSFAISSRTADTESVERIRANKASLARHEAVLQELPRKADLVAVQESVKAIPSAVRKLEDAPSTAREVELAAEQLPLKRHELEALKLILNRAKAREPQAQ